MYFVTVSVRAVIMRAVFNKACRLTAAARNSASVGEMTNLISNDVERIYFGIMMSQQLWVGPILIVACMGMLIREIGPSGLFAVGLMVAYVPLQGRIARRMGRLKRGMLKHRYAGVQCAGWESLVFFLRSFLQFASLCLTRVASLLSPP